MQQPMRQIQQGIALFQVLIIAAMLSVILLSMQHKARSQLALAEAVQNRASLLLQLETIQSKVELAIITGDSSGFIGWNLHNQPFTDQGFTIQIQDFSGLYSISSFGNYHIGSLMQKFGKSESEALSIIAALNAWQKKADASSRALQLAGQPQRHAPLQSLVELTAIPGITPQLYHDISPFITLYQRPFFNPMLAPEAILHTILAPELVQQIMQLRSSGDLTPNMFWRLTNIEPDDTISYSTGPGYRIVISQQDSTVKVSRLYEATFKPHEKLPLTFWHRQRINVLPERVF
ncbi:hypothetical protein [Rheinheimera gaetbuli]